MGFWGKLFGIGAADIYPPEASSAELAPHEGPIIPTRTQLEKVDYHIARFERALDQCSNSARLEELRSNLAYWKAVKAASRFTGGAE